MGHAARAAFLAVLSLFAAVNSGQAIDGTYINPTTGGLYSDPTNWLNGAVADGVDATANFSTLNITADNTVTFDAPHILGRLIFGDIAPSNNWILGAAAASPNILTLQTTAPSLPTITVNNQTATIQAPVAGTQGFIKNGAGTLVLAINADTYTGNVFVNAGTLSLQIGQAATTTFSMANGTTITTNQGLATTNFITAVSGTSTFINTNTTARGGLLAGNGNVNFTLSTTTTFQDLFFSSFGGTATYGNNNAFRFQAPSDAPFATVNFGSTSGQIYTRDARTMVFGGIQSVGTAGGIQSNTNGVSTYIIGSANTSTSFAGIIGTFAQATSFVKVGTGTLTLNPTATYITTGTFSANGGTLLANYVNATSNIFNPLSPLAFGGGTLSLLGKPTGTTAQTFGATTVSGVGGGRLVVNSNGGTFNLTLGSLTGTVNGGTLDINPSNAAGTTTITTTTGPIVGQDGTYGGRFTYTDAAGNTNWLTSASAATPFVLSAYTAYSPFIGAGGTGTNNRLLTDSGAVMATESFNSLKITTTTPGGTLDLGGNTLSLANGGLLFTGANAYAINNGILTGGTGSGPTTPVNGDLIVQQYGTGNLTVGAVIANSTGASTLTKAGPGTLTLTGINTFTGTTNINGGVLSISANNNLGDEVTGAGLLISGGTLQATSSFGLFNGAAGTNNRGVFVGGGGATFDVTGTNNLNIAGVVTNVAANQFGPLIKTNTGTLTLSGLNTYSGATQISGGVLSVATLANGGVASGIGNSKNLAGALVFDGGTLQYTGADVNTDRTFTVTQNGGTLDASGTGVVNFTSPLPIVTTGSGARTLTLTGTNTSGNNTLGLAIVDGTGGATSLVKTGASTWALTNAGHTYTGNTTIANSGSKLILAAPLSVNSIPNSKVITVGQLAGSTAQLDVTGLSAGTISLSSAQTLAGTGTVTGGVIVNNLSVLSPGFNGVGTLTISGALTLNNGSISNFEFNNTSNDMVSVGGAINLNATEGINLFQEGSPTKFTTPGTYNLFSAVGGVNGTASTSFSVLNPATGLTYAFSSNGTQITLTIGGTAAVTSIWNVDANGNYGNPANWNNNTVPDGAGTTAIFGPIITAPRIVTIEANHTVGEIDFNNVNAYTLAPGGGVLTLNNNGNVANIQDFNGSHAIGAPLNLVAGLSTNVANAGNVLTISGNISGVGPMTKIGAGILALTGTNSYTGGTTITNGTIQINSATSLGDATGVATLDSSINAATLEALNSITTARSFALTGVNNTIQVDGAANTYEIDGIIANGVNPGTLTKTGPGTLALGGNNTFTGITTISAGTLQLGGTGANSAAGSVSGNIVNNSALVLNRTDDYTLGNVISGTGTLTQAGIDNVTLSGTNTFSGNTVIQAGSLILGNSLALQNSTLNYNNQGGALSFGTLTAATLGGLTGAQSLVLNNTAAAGVALTVGGNNATTTYSGALSGAGSLTKNGAGTLTLTGVNTYTGVSVVNGGTLELPAGGSITGGALGGGGFLVDGGSLTSTGLSTFAQNFAYNQTAGTASVGEFRSNVNDGTLIRISGGSFTATGITLQRNQAYLFPATGVAGLLAAPIAAGTGSGFVVTNGTVNLGTLLIGNSNSSASARFDGGTTTVSGVTTIGATGGGRVNILQINGGSFTSTETTNGIVVAGVNAVTPANVQNAEFLLTGGTTTANVITFGQPTTGAGSTGTLILNGANAALFVGNSGVDVNNNPLPSGFVQATPGGFTSTISLAAGTLGAKADWTTTLPISLPASNSAVIQTSDAAAVPHTITLGAFDVTANAVAGGLTGTGNLTVRGGGTLVIGNRSDYAGSTNVNAGTLAINNTPNPAAFQDTKLGQLVGTTAININGGQLALTGDATVTDRIVDAAPVTLAGGTFNTNGLTERTAGGPGLGTLTLNANSVIDLGTGVSQLQFANSSGQVWLSGRLSVFNWSGTTAGGGTDQLIFGTDATGLNAQQLTQIQFFTNSGATPVGSGAMILATGEVVPAPVPEPTTTAFIIVLAVGALGWRQRHRLPGSVRQLLDRRAA